MPEKALTERVEIEREGELGGGIFIGNEYQNPWVSHSDLRTSNNVDIANVAIKIGYKTGDIFKYRIIIEPKE